MQSETGFPSIAIN